MSCLFDGLLSVVLPQIAAYRVSMMPKRLSAKKNCPDWRQAKSRQLIRLQR
jgi:hypothetical protein